MAVDVLERMKNDPHNTALTEKLDQTVGRFNFLIRPLIRKVSEGPFYTGAAACLQVLIERISREECPESIAVEIMRITCELERWVEKK